MASFHRVAGMVCFSLVLCSWCFALSGASLSGGLSGSPLLRGSGHSGLVRLRGGSTGHQGSDPNAKDPTGIWSSFQKIGGDADAKVGAGLQVQAICGTWGQGSAKKRSQKEVTLRVKCEEVQFGGGEVLTAFIQGSSFCGVSEHWHTCQCESKEQYTSRAQMTTTKDLWPIWQGRAFLAPGNYGFKFHKVDGAGQGEGEAEVLEGMWGVEESRPLTVLPEPLEDAVLLVSDIDGTLLGDEDHLNKFFWIWNEQYKPRGSHLVYNTGRPFPSAQNLIKENTLHLPTALVCSEGTEIYWFGPMGPEDVQTDDEWREILMLSWPYPEIKAGVEAIVEMMKHEVQDVQFLPDVNGQPMITINVADKGKADNMIGKINHELRESKKLSFDMTCSSGGGNFFILMIPKGAGKGSAALHVSKRLGFAVDKVMVAGDGENDVPLFEATKEGFKGAMVSNAVEGLKAWVSRSPSGHLIHRSMSSQALGILEGLEHHFPSPAKKAQQAAEAAQPSAFGREHTGLPIIDEDSGDGEEAYPECHEEEAAPEEVEEGAAVGAAA